MMRATRRIFTLRPRARRSRQEGFTLIEVLVSMVIMGVVSTMLIGIWIVLTHSAAFAQADNTAAATARDASDRITAELRDCQPPSSSSYNPFIFSISCTYPVNLGTITCDANDCVFYSSYNNAGTMLNSDPTASPSPGVTDNGDATALPTAIILDTSGSANQKTLWWVRDTNKDGSFDAGDKAIKLATNVVNTASTVNKPIFTYTFGTTSGSTTTYATGSLTSSTVWNPPTSFLTSIQVELVVDANLNDKPTYVDLVSVVRPRNVGTSTSGS
jgi:prepilin-type N-terminal cleavage/methylation domain-containing protein